MTHYSGHALVFHGQTVSHIVASTKALLEARIIQPSSERAAIRTQLAAHEQLHSKGGVDFTRIQIPELLKLRDAGEPIEFETIGPYLAHYLDSGGVISNDTLVHEDAIGLELAKEFKRLFPGARLVSLYDDHNKQTLNKTGESGDFTPATRQRFRESLAALFKASGILAADATEPSDYLLIAESLKLQDAPQLVRRLEAQGLIKRDGEEITFVNDCAENPLFNTIRLRTKQGRWLCEALDAASFLKSENQTIAHVVILPEYMKTQQDKVWEILRVLGIRPTHYHNIFFGPTLPVEHVAATIKAEFAKYL